MEIRTMPISFFSIIEEMSMATGRESDAKGSVSNPATICASVVGGGGGNNKFPVKKLYSWMGGGGGKSLRKGDDLFWCFRHFLRFGKVCGVVPFDGIFFMGGGVNAVQLR